MRRRWLVVALVLAGCGRQTPPVSVSPFASEGVTHPIDPWVLSCYDPTATEPALLWNGQIGVRFGRDGGPLGPDGKRLPMFTIDGYSKTGEQKIQPFVNPLPPPPSFEGVTPSLVGCKDYRQLLDMRTGMLTTSWTQQGPQGKKLEVVHKVVLHPSERRMAERWSFVIDWKVGDPTLPEFPDVPPYLAEGPPGQPFTVIDSDSGSFQDKTSLSAYCDRDEEIGAANTPRSVPQDVRESFDKILADSKRVWSERWKTDIVIDGPVEDQQRVRSFLFYLRSAIAAQPNIGTKGWQSDRPLSPFGLSNATYNGHMFWDADIWVFPALALIDPDEATTIPEYRLAKMGQASKNYQRWLKSGKRVSDTRLNNPSPPSALMFPWESGLDGSETMPGPSRFEHHITGSVAFAFKQAADLGFVSESDAQRMIRGADAFYRSRSIPGPNGREIPSTLSPDENRVVSNDLYTNLLAEWLHDGGKWPDNARTTYKLPRDRFGFQTYDNDPHISYQQAAAVLSIYPLQYPPAEAEAFAMMQRFGNKVSQYGPAMSDSVHAIIWARDGEFGNAHWWWKRGCDPFMNAPLGLFSERRAVTSTYFLTGAAGGLQTVLYGFLGIRIDSKPRSEQAWSKKLDGDRYLSVMPHLPPEWKSVKLKNFTVLGRRYTLTETQAPDGGSAKVTQGD